MSDISAFNSGVLGIQRGLNQLNRSASDIASAKQMSNDQATDITQSLIELKEAQLQVKASTEVLKTADSLIGSLIDIMA